MKKFLERFFLVFAFVSTMSLIYCGDDDDDAVAGKVCSGTWYLVSWNDNICNHGEYMKFSGSTLYWNKRLGGENTTYSFKETSYGFDITDGIDSYKFEVQSIDAKNIVTYSSDGNIRYWKR